jgi:4-amino-4-deoxy-L-arabinose transferase-like glycosyltransferase
MARSALRDVTILALLGLATLAVHLWTGGHYGFHRDELATLDDARHLAWGYVAYPPLTPFFGHLSLLLFGASLTGFRFFAALAEAMAVVITGLMARALGGSTEAQLLAAAAAVPFCLVGGSLMQYVSFDYLFWVLAAYGVIRMLESEDPRWWVAIGAAMGLGMMSKYSMVFFAIALGVALWATGARRHLASRWFWIGAAVAVAIVTPNLIWEARHSFVSLEFLRSIHARDVLIGRTQGFLPDQLKITMLASVLALAGLYFYSYSGAGQRFRVLAWLYVALLALFLLAKGRGYYLAAGYPMLYAAGAVWGERAVTLMTRSWAARLRAAMWVAVLLDVAIVSAATLPLAPADSALGKFALRQNGDLREEFGWEELAETVAQIRNSHRGAAILVSNYGDAGAIDFYGPRYGLPQALSGVNSFWARGYGSPAPESVILVGFGRDWADRHFATCELAGHAWNRYGVKNEDTEDHPDIFVCGALRGGWQELWQALRSFG